MTNVAKGILYIISAPSGGGKTSLVHEVIRILPNIGVSISHTTRSPRPGEKDGVDYYFVVESKFEQLKKEHIFLEHAVVFDHQYGTSHEAVEKELTKGHDVILEIDWQGAQQVRRVMKETVSIFILPPSRKELAARLRDRGQDDDEVIARRLALASTEISHCHEYGYLIVNDKFEMAVHDLCAIIEANRLQQSVQSIKHAKLIESLK